ncbi:hypothetical protein N7474_000946 [Penicillium riverlandense]|uniref:uncharacterized protein n=1 Tax=Penicillium riverlandense TaxID=1903569 RepID=UPI0025484217|nr:uncharacterized protein N7474_000946 [Penicillium riverlandense]KAJ5832635.1 hypothetical protein N7474_000946 [Penicillium riverlandense]
MYLPSTLVITSLLASIINGSPIFPLAREPDAQPTKTLTFTEPENNGYCFVKLDNVLGCSGETVYPIGMFVDDRCTKCNASMLQLYSIIPTNQPTIVTSVPDNGASSVIPVCDRKLTVTWTKDEWDNQQVTLKYPKADIVAERMQIIGVNSYARGVANVVGVTGDLPKW